LASDVGPPHGLAGSTAVSSFAVSEGYLRSRPHSATPTTRLPALRKLGASVGLSGDALEYSLRRYKLNTPTGNQTLKDYERYFSLYSLFRAEATDPAPVYAYTSVLNAAVWLRGKKKLSHSTLKPFLSSFSVFHELKFGKPFKDISLIKDFRKSATKFTKVLLDLY
jgi:hypothetical protein